MSTSEIKFQKNASGHWVAAYFDSDGNSQQDLLLGKLYVIERLSNGQCSFRPAIDIDNNQVHAVMLTELTEYMPGDEGKYNMWLGNFEILTRNGVKNGGYTSSDFGITAIGTADIADVGTGGMNIRTLQYGLPMPVGTVVFIFMPSDRPGLMLIHTSVIDSTHEMRIRTTSRTNLTWKY
jgi:hypothetical protein